MVGCCAAICGSPYTPGVVLAPLEKRRQALALIASGLWLIATALGGLALHVVGVAQPGLIGVLALVLFALSTRLSARKMAVQAGEEREKEKIAIVPE